MAVERPRYAGHRDHVVCPEGLSLAAPWTDCVPQYASWPINIGLAVMVLLNVPSVGLARVVASIYHGLTVHHRA